MKSLCEHPNVTNKIKKKFLDVNSGMSYGNDY
jgi:hypothetical protein